MKWKDLDKPVLFFNYNILYQNRVNGRSSDPLYCRSWVANIYNNGYIYPKKDLSNLDTFETKTIQPESTLYFDAGSGFPRFKLSLSDSKRCIKIVKADYIVVSGSNDWQTPSYNYVVLEDDTNIYMILEDDWNQWFNSLAVFVNACSPYHTFTGQTKVIYQGRVNSYTKESVYMAKYLDGQYTKPFITDINLDKLICAMCPEPTYEEFESILEMLNSEDASVVQLGVKMLAGYNVDKYKLSMRLMLLTRANWYLFTKNTVGTKQLVETLRIDNYQISDDFARGAYYVQKANEVYTVEDVAIAKKLSSKLIRNWLQDSYNKYLLNSNYEWLPDERKVTLE